jgi:hypothetical protein
VTAPTLARPTTVEQAHAAASLVHARDGLATTLLHLAEDGALLDITQACQRIEPALAALDQPERHQRALGITDAAYAAHGTWYEGHPDRDQAAARLVHLVLAAADRVIHVIRLDACLCREVRS